MKKNPTQLERVSHNLLVKNSQHLSFGDFIQAIFKVLSLDTKKERGILSSIIHQKKIEKHSCFEFSQQIYQQVP